MTKDEALKMALDALEYHTAQTRPIHETYEAINAIKEALAQPEQPAPQHPWVGLTDEEKKFYSIEAPRLTDVREIIERVETTLRTRNT